MGRGKIEIAKIENRTTRQVTFSKRRVGLFKKTHELSVLCDAHIGLIVFSTNGKLFEYSSQSSNMNDIIRKYQRETGTSIPDHTLNNPEQLNSEMRLIKRKTDEVQLRLQRYSGDQQYLSSIHLRDLDRFENELELSVNKVRARKLELLHQQMDNLRRKEKILDEENEQIYHLIREQEMAMEQQEAAMKMMQKTEILAEEDLQISQNRLIHDQPNEFPFFNEIGDGPSSVLQLAPLPPPPSSSSPDPPPFHPYRLQPIQPNLQDHINLHHSYYE